ncbi:MAG: hypothetical protein AseanaTS_08320 [Candidatus Pelagadaptatus aseana]|uniref:CBS domain-containing protein n=1 Tax=Candidatus Pelagadaptatus aseana TaxID=3120508 RepID=UPI0039B19F91
MPFQVYEQGRGIATPWYDVFPPRHVNKANASGGPHKVSPRDQYKDGDHPYGSAVAGRQRKPLFSAAPVEQQRHPVFFAEQIMSKPVQSVAPGLNLVGLWQQFSQWRFRHFPVLDGQGRLLGLVSDRDALQASSSLLLPDTELLNGKSDRLTVGDVMSHKVLTATADTYLRTLAEVMLDHRVGAMPIMAGEQLIGIVTRSDILRTLTHQTPIDLWT